MGSNVSRYILSIISFVIQVLVVEVKGGLIVQGLEKRSRRRDTNQEGSKSNGKIYLKMRTEWFHCLTQLKSQLAWSKNCSNRSAVIFCAQTKNCWNMPIQMNVVSWRQKMGSVIWKQSSTHWTCLIISIVSVWIQTRWNWYTLYSIMPETQQQQCSPMKL